MCSNAEEWPLIDAGRCARDAVSLVSVIYDQNTTHRVLVKVYTLYAQRFGEEVTCRDRPRLERTGAAESVTKQKARRFGRLK